jgi:hypothetical protein
MSLTKDLELIRRAVELIRARPKSHRPGPMDATVGNLLEAVAQGGAAFSAAKGDTTEEMYRWSSTVVHAVTLAEQVIEALDPYIPDVGPIPAEVWDAVAVDDEPAEPVDLDAIAADRVVVPFRARR